MAHGFILPAELLLILLMIIGVIVGLTSLRDSTNAELNDIAEAFGALDQSYQFNGLQNSQSSAGMAFSSWCDDSDTNAGDDVGWIFSTNGNGGASGAPGYGCEPAFISVQGSGGTSSFIANGTDVTYSANFTIDPNKVEVYVDDVLQTQDVDYTVIDDDITFGTSPAPDTSIIIIDLTNEPLLVYVNGFPILTAEYCAYAGSVATAYQDDPNDNTDDGLASLLTSAKMDQFNTINNDNKVTYCHQGSPNTTNTSSCGGHLSTAKGHAGDVFSTNFCTD
jgi:hypothetical protein